MRTIKIDGKTFQLHDTIERQEAENIARKLRKEGYYVRVLQNRSEYYGIMDIWKRRREITKEVKYIVDVATDELAEALADFDAKISPDDEEAYDCMRQHVEQAQIMLLELLK